MTDLELISQISEFNDLHDFLGDEQLDRALELVIKLLVKPEAVNPAVATKLIVELQALATKFALSASVYKTIKRDRAGTENAYRKDLYYSLTDAINKLVDSLKYMSRYGQ